MTGVFLKNGERVEGWGYKYAFNTVEEAKEACDPYGYREYQYKEVKNNEISLDREVDLMIQDIFNSRRASC